mmetsp:Transcript_13286/g.38614  ORF Transcript_13286/g.38614 Transcript_13286/m.38614 type:complete len:273 (+) Transcript_13286:137-955(+)
MKTLLLRSHTTADGPDCVTWSPGGWLRARQAPPCSMYAWQPGYVPSRHASWRVGIMHASSAASAGHMADVCRQQRFASGTVMLVHHASNSRLRQRAAQHAHCPLLCRVEVPVVLQVLVCLHLLLERSCRIKDGLLLSHSTRHLLSHHHCVVNCALTEHERERAAEPKQQQDVVREAGEVADVEAGEVDAALQHGLEAWAEWERNFAHDKSAEEEVDHPAHGKLRHHAARTLFEHVDRHAGVGRHGLVHGPRLGLLVEQPGVLRHKIVSAHLK